MRWILVARAVCRPGLMFLCAALLVTGTSGHCAQSDNEAVVVVENDAVAASPAWEIPSEVLRLQIKYLSLPSISKTNAIFT